MQVLLKHLGLENSEGSLAQKLASAKQILAQTIIPAVRDIELRKGPGSPAFLDMSSYPLGFSMGDEKTDLAAKILRMLYIKDLRALQTQIDDMIVQIQEFTANPRIVASLGVVGR
ncbi:hypothetical protein COCSUDRAFT_59071 [Coccomyxa subellipsoidea C-169]|uniref:Uncharacterized protein n=1 Tax=Coccomyxa subellipsoidea (strain C-169) TaxID=574566 RepID=I0Z7C6_COCSC|nr:hypothetical protein COCSUDRAFT_59071 [Coccomyxa subellipsoidea C-169]EIE26545.1 hypothetical protein COCSUDRAFT_59071 [Coccomyxa subellipsoidea C-169]|eukprot:XP_005651089.1 hypothetical protein COCSUDRAFT_59071 [Coccomyxa subellipsoidea C-169]